MNETKITRSQNRLKIWIINSGLVGLFCAITATILMLILFEWTPWLIAFTWFGLFFAWAISAYFVTKWWNNSSYSITDESLIVSTSRPGIFGTSESSVYRYESIASISVKQDYFGKKYNYGDIVVNMPKVEDVVLRDVANPKEELIKLKKIIAERNGNDTQALIN
jgi:uncharacterized membrane protein YdbT with pleckstrin-like domain